MTQATPNFPGPELSAIETEWVEFIDAWSDYFDIRDVLTEGDMPDERAAKLEAARVRIADAYSALGQQHEFLAPEVQRRLALAIMGGAWPLVPVGTVTAQ